MTPDKKPTAPGLDEPSDDDLRFGYFDIVDVLRQRSEKVANRRRGLLIEAADEIERLRAALSQPVPSAPEPSQKYDDTLLPFLALMRRELHANSRKGDRPGWLTMSREVGLLEIYWHTAKLSAAVKNNDAAAISEHCADVANMAMMLLDVCGGIETSQMGVANGK